MTYPAVTAPYGLQPINRIDGMPYAGAIRQIPVATGFGTAIFDGDTVLINSDGVLVKSSTTDSGGIVGVCVGGQYVNSSGQTVQGQFIPALASTSTNPALAYVVDDPMALFKVAVVTSGTTMGTAGRTVVGSNLPLVLNPGNTATGNSAFAVTLTGAGTGVLLIRQSQPLSEFHLRLCQHDLFGRCAARRWCNNIRFFRRRSRILRNFGFTGLERIREDLSHTSVDALVIFM